MATKKEIELLLKARDAASGAVTSVTTALRDLSGAQDQVATGAPRVDNALTRIGNAARRTQQAVSGANRGGFLGLRPHELANLNFQLQDVVVGLSSGQRPLTVLIQQGSQIAQIFPRAAGALLRFVPAIAAVTAVVAPFIAAFQRAADLEASTQRFNTLLATTADGATISGQQLAQAARDIGGGLSEAEASIRAFVAEGVAPDHFVALGRDARTLAQALGIEVPDAAQRLAEAFTGDFDAVKHLDDALDFLTQAERAHIRELFESGRAAEARAEALRIFESRTNSVAEQARGPWSDAFRELAGAWNELVIAIEDIGFVNFVRNVLGAMARELHAFASFLREFVEETRQVFTFLFQGEEALRRRQEQVARRANRPAAPIATDPRADNQRTRKADEDEAIERAIRLRREAERTAEQAREQARQFREDLQAQNDLRAFELSIIGETVEKQEILREIHAAELAAREAGVELSEEELANARASVEALQQRRRELEEQNTQLEKAKESTTTRFTLSDLEDGTNRVVDSLANIVTGITSWENALRSLANTFRQIAAEILADLAKMILKQTVFNALQSAGKNGNGGIGGAIARAVQAAVLHAGGLASQAPRRSINAALFGDGVRRFREGGFPGLRPGEIPAILKRNEEVLTRDDPRHALNGGGSPKVDLTVVNTLDPGEIVSAGLSTRVGETKVLNMISANKTAFRTALGV